MLLKLVILILAVGAVWYGFRVIARRSAGPLADARAETKGIEASETVRCAACGTYVAPELSGSCGRPDCPY